MEKVKFHFDPRCPWCYQTSRWARRLAELGEIELDWGIFSLEVVNLEEGKDPTKVDAVSGPALRTAIMIRDSEGSQAIGPFYAALGKRIWEQEIPQIFSVVKPTVGTQGAQPAIQHSGVSGDGVIGVVQEDTRMQDNIQAVKESLAEVGLDPALCDKALADPATWQAVLDEHNALIERTRSFGVPTIVLDGGTGPAIFGPVISELPNDNDGVGLWKAVSWLARYENFSELKRDRVTPPDLPAVAYIREQRALGQSS